MTTTLMALTDDEVKIVKRHREHLEYLRLRDETQAKCAHSWRFECHGHNDDAYVCTKCGASEWR